MTNGGGDIKKGSLKHAIEIASKPLRVMDQVDSTDEKIVAVLHDVIEKSPQWPLNRLASEGFKPKVIKAVEAMTRRSDESYEDFVLRAAANPTSRQ